MSLREIDVALTAIGDRKGIEYKMQAALHGLSVGGKDDQSVQVNITDDHAEIAMRSIQETLARKQREAATRVGQ